MESRFAKSIKTSRGTKPLLPLVHNCEAYDFREIMESESIAPTLCDTFSNEELSYFFYGKPSYRTAKTSDASSMSAYFPTCFVIDAPKLNFPKRVFPIDSGAFSAKLFNEFMHRKTDISDFSLPPKVDSAARVVSYFFGKNRSYYDSKPKQVDITPIEFEVQSYYELISHKAPTQFDDRRASIELQYNDHIELNKTKVHLVIIPNAFLDEPFIKKKILEEWKAEIRTYYTTHCNPNEYISTINRELRDFLIDKRFM